MTVISNFSVRNPKKIEMTMNVTMTIEEWVSLRSRISEDKEEYWSSSNAFCRTIKELVDKASKEFQAYENWDKADEQ